MSKNSRKQWIIDYQNAPCSMFRLEALEMDDLSSSPK
jgi:hypothetical protein